MKPICPPTDSRALTEAAGRALRRASRRGQETARRYGTPVWVMSDGRLVALRPQAPKTGRRP